MGDGNTHSEIMLAGAFAAFTIDLLVYPMDTIKTRLQSRDFLKTYAASPAPSSGAAAAVAVRRAASSVYAFRGLYQGLGIVIIATLPSSSVFFTTYETAKSVLGRAIPAVTGRTAAPPSAFVHSLSSGIAEMASCLVLTPAEVIKQNAQMIHRQSIPAPGSSSAHGTKRMPNPSPSASLQALRMLLRTDNPSRLGSASIVSRRLLSGYTALVARNLPFTALQFPMFEALRVRLRTAWDKGPRGSGDNAWQRQLLLTGAINGLSAGASGAIAAVITTPTDVIKTRMMLLASSQSWDGSESEANRFKGDSKAAVATAPKPCRRLSGLQLTRLIYRDHGIQGLFRGGALRAVWTFVGSGLYLGTYEMAKAWLRRGREGAEDTIDL